MRLKSLLNSENERLDEALGKWGTLGALGAAAALGGWIGAQNHDAHAAGTFPLKPGQELLDLTPAPSKPPPSLLGRAVPKPPAPETGKPQATTPEKPGSQAKTGAPHPNFPKTLHGQERSSPSERIKSFSQSFAPAVEAVNREIQQDRNTLIRLSGKKLTPEEKRWLESRMDYYRTDNPKELLRRMDVIPVSLALSQAAIESGWATSDIARQHNAFFGQKAWSDKNSVLAPGGERYRVFDSPEQSIRAYMRNLNTHPAYETLRQTRWQLKRTRKPVTGVALADGLEKYSTRGQDYIRQVKSLIQSRGWSSLDK